MKASRNHADSSNQPPIPTLWKRRFMRGVMRILFTLFSRTEVSGLENLSAVQGGIIAVNHLGYLDAPLTYMLVPRHKISGLAATDYQRHAFFSWIVNTVNGIWINRDELDMNALRAARAYLQSGWLLGIAPEGTRSRTRALISAKTGVAYLADKASVPVIPVAITGTDAAFQQLRHLRRPYLTIRFGRPLYLPPVARRSRETDLRRNTDEIMCQIAAMLPDSYHGVYADHPRLAELLSEQDLG